MSTTVDRTGPGGPAGSTGPGGPAGSTGPGGPADSTGLGEPTTTLDGVVDRTAGRAAAPFAAAASLLRRRGIVHPRGLQYRAEVTVLGSSPGLAGTVLGTPATHQAVVRFSRSVGTPPPVPDAFGLAVRLLDVGASEGEAGWQDLLLLTSASGRAARNVILPARGFAAGFYSTIVPFRVGGELQFLGARPELEGPPRPLTRFDELALALAADQLSFTLQVATVTGPWADWGRLTVGHPLPAEDRPRLQFSPYHDAGGIEPVGPLNALRRRVYLGSQSSRLD